MATLSLQGSLFNLAASSITLASGFVRLVVLARLLLPEHFGVFTLAMFFLSLTTQLQRFGLSKAFIHRRQDSESHIGTFASLRVGLTLIAVLATMALAPLLTVFYSDQTALPSVLIALALFELLHSFNHVGECILAKGMKFKRLAILNVVSSLTMTVVAPVLALWGAGVWALVAERATGVIVRLGGLWFYRPPWKFSFRLDRSLVRWYLNYGKFAFLNTNLRFFLDRFGDFWTGTFLGSTALGFYSRSFQFAQYPRRLMTDPLLNVFFSTFAGLQKDRLRLSKAFFRVCGLLVRAGFLGFGAFSVIAPEFVRLFLGEKWLPMVLTLQLMLVYMLLSPLLSACGNLLGALGHPQQNTQVRIVQAVVFLPLVMVLSRLMGINGVALAEDIMLVVGVAVFFRKVSRFVDFSLRRLLLVPTLALVLGMTAAVATLWWSSLANPWIGLMLKLSVMSSVYLAVSLALEKQEYSQALELLRHHWRPQSGATTQA